MTVRVADLPDLGTVTDAASLVGEHAGAGRFAATAVKAYLAGYTAPYTGGTARTVSAKLGETISDRDFGCAGDGTTDDTSNLQKAINAAAGRTLRLSGGTYKITGGLTASAALRIVGDGSRQSVIHNTNAALNVPLLKLTSAATIGSIVQDIGLTSVGGVGSACAGLQVDGGQDFHLLRLHVNGTAIGINIPITQSGAEMVGCFVDGVSGSGYIVDAGNMVVADCYAINTGGNGFQFTSVTAASGGLVVRGCTAYSTGTGGVAGEGFIFQGNVTYQIIDLIVSDCVSATSPHGAGFNFDTHGEWIAVSNLFVELAGMTAAVTTVSSQPGVYFSANNSGVTLSNIVCQFCYASGIQMECGKFALQGAVLAANNAGGGGVHGGLLLGAGGAITNFTVSGVNTAVPTGLPNSQAFGVNSYTSGNVGHVIGCTLAGTSAGFNNAGGTALFAFNNGSNSNISGSLTIADASTTNAASLIINAAADAAGGAGIELIGNGGTTAKKFIRAQSGAFQVVNDAYTTAILTLTDAGALTVPAAMTASAFAGPAVGVATNSNAAAGNVGEYISATLVSGSAVSLTTGTSANVTSISLTAGDWDVSGNVGFTIGVGATALQAWINTVSATPPSGAGAGGYSIITSSGGELVTGTLVSAGPTRISLASTTTVYLGTNASFSATTVAAWGFIGARRAR
jgi:hypothetical protein